MNRALIMIAGCAGLLACSRATDPTTRGAVVGGSPQRALRVAYGDHWTPERVPMTVPVAANGEFAVPASATSVVVFDDLDHDGALTAWEDRPFFCVREREWRCEVATSRIVIRTLQDQDAATYPFEVLWLASSDVPPPAVCRDGQCHSLTLHPRGAHSFAQLCESMKDATLRVQDADGDVVEIPLSVALTPLSPVSLAADRGGLSARFSARLMRARAWTTMQASENARELDVEILPGGRMMTAKLESTCDAPECTSWIHVAHLAQQERWNGLLVDRVDEVVHEIGR